MKWAKMTDREKEEQIITAIMQWKYFQNSDTYHSALWQTGAYVSIGYPVAFWNEQIEYWCVFYRENEDAHTFHPLHNMHDAWQIIENITEPSKTPEAAPFATTRFAHWFTTADLWACTAHEAAEAICLAALNAVGMEIEP